MLRTPNSTVLTFELPTAHHPSLVESDFFHRIQDNPQSNQYRIEAYAKRLYNPPPPHEHKHNRFAVFNDTQVDSHSHSNGLWHVDGLEKTVGFKDTDPFLTTMSGSMPTYFAKCVAEINRNSLRNDKRNSHFDMFGDGSTSVQRLMLAFLFNDVLGIDWVEIASGEAEITEKFLKGSEIVRVYDAQIMKSLPFVFYSGRVTQTLHRSVAKTAEDPSNRLFSRLVHSKKMKRRTRPSDRFIAELLAQEA